MNPRRWIMLTAGLLALLLLSIQSAPTMASADEISGPGYVMKGRILATYEAGGGVPVLGLPLDKEQHSTVYRSFYQPTELGRVWWSRSGGGKAVPDTFTVRLAGARGNFRDVAGEARDQLPMKRGVVYRSADLDTTTAMDRYILQTLGVSVDVLLNGGSDPAIAGISRVSAKMTAGSGDSRYVPFVTSSTQRAVIRKALTAIANAKGATVIHCAAGKDRTGWVSAVLQMLAGTSQDLIVREYLKSGWKTYGAQSVRETWLRRGLTAMSDRYGDVEGYVLDGLGLPQATLDRLLAKIA